ncbi:ubiquitin-like-conjugating enzyme ATG10 isoform X2 [Metopolophium dirhodum]|uniref:ubiquitin-like-conjugating enzyme ATG10 isoform X2 n=1 Tax=Metopolophium dirhodum TaxID=44670 RepID=UPI00298FED5F|nr:ubiquitin-like-conjugating enzyme ATG10 isoform X2 [Metopolophium dirhodum]
MSMTYQQFVEYATDLKYHSDSIDDGWSLRQYQCPMILLRKTKFQLFVNITYCTIQVIRAQMCSLICDGKLLSLEHVWSLVHSFLKQNVVHDKWNAITQEMHPFSNSPFFRLHPCKNTHVLEMLGFSSKNSYEFNPLIAWLSTISPLIGLEIDLSYGNQRLKS